MQIFAPVAFTHSCIATSSPCSRRISASYGLRFIRASRPSTSSCFLCLLISSCPERRRRGKRISKDYGRGVFDASKSAPAAGLESERPPRLAGDLHLGQLHR